MAACPLTPVPTRHLVAVGGGGPIEALHRCRTGVTITAAEGRYRCECGAPILPEMAVAEGHAQALCPACGTWVGLCAAAELADVDRLADLARNDQEVHA